jgi:hypothetical protein
MAGTDFTDEAACDIVECGALLCGNRLTAVMAVQQIGPVPYILEKPDQKKNDYRLRRTFLVQGLECPVEDLKDPVVTLFFTGSDQDELADDCGGIIEIDIFSQIQKAGLEFGGCDKGKTAVSRQGVGKEER